MTPDAVTPAVHAGTLVVRGGRLFDPGTGLDETGDLVIEGGRIRYHGTAAELKSRPEILHSAYLRRESDVVGGEPK